MTKMNDTCPETASPLSPTKTIEIEAYLKSKLDAKRYAHVLSVRDTAINLAKRYGANVHTVNLASLLHDCAKWMSTAQLYEAVQKHGIKLDEIERQNVSLLHALIGVELAISHFKVDDPQILSAVRVHTTGSGTMTLIDKILYVADFSEPLRPYDEADWVRELAEEDLNQAVYEVCRCKITRLLAKGVLIHPNTINAYNRVLEEIRD